MKKITTVLFVLALSACSYAPQRYSISVGNNVALKTIGVGNINVGSFTKTADFNSNCRGTGGVIGAPDNMSFEGYIQNGLIDELKLAGMFDDKAPKIILSGDVEQLSFSSMRSLTGGTWDIGLRVNSSNGKSIYVSEHYEFDAGVGGFAACQKVADYYMHATQNVLGKLITSPDFKSLVTPKNQANQQNDSQSSATAAPSQPNLAASDAPANTASKTGASMNESVSQKLRELQSLRKDGIITEDEFLKKKQQLLEKL